MTGTLVNVGAIIIGGLFGAIFGHRFPDKYKSTVIHGLGLAVILVGMQMALKSENILIVILSIVFGGIIGELIAIEDHLHNLGRWIEGKFTGGHANGNFATGFVRTSLIYCVGAMAIMGAIQDGISNDSRTLFAKALIDGFTAIPFAATLGVGVIFSAIPVLLYQGMLTIAAKSVAALMTEGLIREMEATGGILIMAIGLNVLEITNIKVGNLLPAIFVAIALASFLT